MSTKKQLRGKPPKPRAGTSTLTPGVSGGLTVLVNAAIGDREPIDHSSLPDKTVFIHGCFRTHEKMFESWSSTYAVLWTHWPVNQRYGRKMYLRCLASGWRPGRWCPFVCVWSLRQRYHAHTCRWTPRPQVRQGVCYCLHPKIFLENSYRGDFQIPIDFTYLLYLEFPT